MRAPTTSSSASVPDRASPLLGVRGNGVETSAPEPPHATIVVLNYNGRDTIERCLRCLTLQTYPRFDVVVVDNASDDGSLDRIRPFVSSGRLSVLALPRNRGCTGGRNAALPYATGEIVAFVDGDGYAHPDWLEEAVRELTRAEDVAAVASLVTFAWRPAILNGAGGTLNLRGYGGDLCFNEPLESAELPQEVLYPMGCGMVVRREALETVGPFDDALFNYYDDVDLGIRLWCTGRRVVLAPRARVDHDFGSADRFLRTKTWLCERNRIRTVLKYFPARVLPAWLVREFRSLAYARVPGQRTLPLRAWVWNLAHLVSALRTRRRFAASSGAVLRLLHPSWDPFVPATPQNTQFRLRPERFSERVLMDGARDEGCLDRGWYFPEMDGWRWFRWTDGDASLFLRAERPVRFLTASARALSAGSELEILLRPAELPAAEARARAESAEAALGHTLFPLDDAWSRRTWRIDLPAGCYEVVLRGPAPQVQAGRPLGAAVSSVGLF